jgi:hypothetical protein
MAFLDQVREHPDLQAALYNARDMRLNINIKYDTAAAKADRTPS